jgi:hypothetical protein
MRATSGSRKRGIAAASPSERAPRADAPDAPAGGRSGVEHDDVAGSLARRHDCAARDDHMIVRGGRAAGAEQRGPAALRSLCAQPEEWTSECSRRRSSRASHPGPSRRNAHVAVRTSRELVAACNPLARDATRGWASRPARPRSRRWSRSCTVRADSVHGGRLRDTPRATGSRSRDARLGLGAARAVVDRTSRAGGRVAVLVVCGPTRGRRGRPPRPAPPPAGVRV